MKRFTSLAKARQWCNEVQAGAPVGVLVRNRAYIVQVIWRGHGQKTGFLWLPCEVSK